MTAELPVVFLARHGETAWTITGQHTGLSDIPLTPHGEDNARRLGARLAGEKIDRVFTSPLIRVRRTCELAGYADRAEVDRDLVEWNYGEYDGLTSAEIRKRNPGWQLFRDGCPGGESLGEVAARADRVITRVRELSGRVLLFSSGHFSRVLGVRWLGLEVACGRLLYLGTASLSILGYEHNPAEPVLRLWNDRRHVEE